MGELETATQVIQGPDVTLWGGSQFATLVLEASEARVCNLTLYNASPSAAVLILHKLSSRKKTTQDDFYQ